MSGDYIFVFINQHRVEESKFPNACCDLLDLGLGVYLRIACVGYKLRSPHFFLLYNLTHFYTFDFF